MLCGIHVKVCGPCHCFKGAFENDDFDKNKDPFKTKDQIKKDKEQQTQQINQQPAQLPQMIPNNNHSDNNNNDDNDIHQEPPPPYNR